MKEFEDFANLASKILSHIKFTRT